MTAGIKCISINDYPLVDLCSSYPCANLGICERLPGNYSCKCVVGFGGPNCKINLCEEKACNKANTMSLQCTYNKLGEALCPCRPGFTGDRCEVSSRVMCGLRLRFAMMCDEKKWPGWSLSMWFAYILFL